MNGDNVRNAVLRPHSATGGGRITAGHLEAAARVDFEDMGNLTT